MKRAILGCWLYPKLNRRFLMMAVALACIGETAYSQPNPVAYWPLTGSTYDYASGYSGVLDYGATFGLGPQGQALVPSGGYMRTSENLYLPYGWTLTTWVNLNGSSQGAPILAMRAFSGFGYYYVFGIAGALGLCGSTNQVYLAVYSGYGLSGCYTSNSLVPSGTWTHLAITWDGNTTLQFYVNGNGDPAAPVNLSTGSPYTDLEIGGNTYAYTGFSTSDSSFNGSIYEFRLYDSALSQTDIRSVMVAGEGTLPAPTFYPGTGTYGSATNVYISNSGASNGASMRYTTDGSTPSHTNGTLSTATTTGPITVSCSTTLKAIAYQTNWLDSGVSSAIITISAGTVAAPTFSVGGGTYITPQTVTLTTTTSGATIRYTLDGSTPSETNGTIGTSVTINSSATLKAIAYKGCPWTDSAITSATYTITGTVATPTFSPGGGTYTGAQTVTISSSTSGATIRYTTDGSTPSETHGTIGTSVLVRSTETLQAIAYKSQWADSGVASATYTITGTVTQNNPPPVGTPGSDSGNGMDPRRIGVRVLGSYWGAAGEEIDTTSGNLNFSLPLFKVMSRGGWSVTFRLSYNSQMWRQDAAGTWLLGNDVGYGMGWILQAGSLVPVWSNTSQIDHYLYIDSTGAEYSLATNTGGVWTGREGVYISFDSNTNRLYFPDGSFWVMGSQSASGEADAGTMYPTLMQDRNGNQVVIGYQQGAGGGGVNTSSRICAISDPRNGGWNPCTGWGTAFYLTYNSDSTPHLTGLSNFIGTAENYTFAYATQALNSPFSSPIAYGPATLLQSVGISGLGIAHNFQYDASGSGELIQITTPLGGTLQWAYRTFAYGSGISLREVQTRQMASLPGATPNSWSFAYDDTSSPTFHVSTTISDAGAGTHRTYYVSTQDLYNQTTTTLLPYALYEYNQDGSNPVALYYSWLEENGNVHKYVETTVYDPSTANAAKMTYQYQDSYGNITQFHVFDYGHNTNPADWVYNQTYVTDGNYTSRHIGNLLSQSTVTINNNLNILVTNQYDGSGLLDRPGLVFHDSSYGTSFHYRGNLTGTTPSNTYLSYDIGGVAVSSADGMGRSISSNSSSSTNYSLPSVLTPGSNSNLASTVSYASSWAVSQVIEPNGATSTTNYDSWGRPSSSTLADGAVTNYSYGYNPNTQTAAVSNPPEDPSGYKWKRTTLDGFGRVIRVETGHESTTVSIVDTQYAPCACSPLGKTSAVSQPYAPGATPVWTRYTYDGAGRTLTVTAPDGSVTRYSYLGNSTTVTDPAGKWKTTTVDAQGNVKTVTEPNPAGGANFVTTYSYDAFNHVSGVTMTRPEGTQTRSFVYYGPDLVSATNPENGTVTYSYNNAHQVITRTDAKNQQTQYGYDAYGRLNQVSHPSDPYERPWTYYYDTPIDANYGATNTWGRVTAVNFGGSAVYGMPSFTYEYSYSTAGRVTAQRMEADNVGSGPIVLDATYTWDNEGRISSRTYPIIRPLSPTETNSYGYQYDPVGRLSGLTQPYCGFSAQDGSACYQWGTNTLTTASYGPASELTSLSYYGYSETFSYNSLLQLTRQAVPGVFDMQYNFPAGQNNGQISSSVEYVSGEQVNYTYDALKRLTAASTTGPQWGQTFSYDGFGNLTAKTVTKGAGANWAQAYDPSTNHAIANPGLTYDANGNQYNANQNQSFDTENRLTSSTTFGYWYDPSGKRVLQTTGGSPNTWILYFYDIFGKPIESLSGDANYPNSAYTLSANIYFGGRLVVSNGVPVVTDRLGSVRANANGERFSYLPYGEEETPTANGRAKFGTYLRDLSGFDYADQRYYDSWWGRFKSADPSTGVNPADPGSWNKYAYVSGDPVNFADPSGLEKCQFDSSDLPCFSVSTSSSGFDPIGTLPAGMPHEIYNPNRENQITEAPTRQDRWDELSADCQNALRTAVPNTGTGGLIAALDRANAAMGTLVTAVAGTSIDWTMLAAIGIRESAFRNTSEVDGAGVGVGVFQITVGPKSGVTAAQAGNLAWAASYAAQLLASNMSYLASQFPNFTPSQLMQATAASYNMNPYKPGNFTGNPNTIDDGTAHGNYGSNVMQLINCFH